MLRVHAHPAFCAGDRVAVIDVREQRRFRKGLPGASGMHGDRFAAAQIAGQDDLTLLQGEYVLCAVSLPEKKLPGTQLARLRAWNEFAENLRQHRAPPPIVLSECTLQVANESSRSDERGHTNHSRVV